MAGYDEPEVEIQEQPAPRRHRFRYEREVEGRSAGSIFGIHSAEGAKTYPTIRVKNYHGPFNVVVSCVTADGPPYRPHPHKLIGQNCKDGIYSARVENSDMTHSFTNLGVECVRRRDVQESLRERKRRGVDPFQTGFGNLNGMKYNVLRLCFQVFIPRNHSSFLPLKPVVSGPIRDRKAAMSNLKIMKLSHCSAPASGGKEVILLCERISRNDVEIWFFEIKNGRVVWEEKADFTPADVHRQVAISFRTPRYYMDILAPVQVYVQLGTSAEGQERGEPLPFTLYPRRRETLPKNRKRVMDMIELYSQYLQDGRGDSNTVAAKIPDHFSSPVKVPRTRRSENREYEGSPGSEYSSQALGSPFFAQAMAPDFTLESSSSYHGTPSQSTAFESPSETSSQLLGPSSDMSNSHPSTFPSLNLTSQNKPPAYTSFETAIQSTVVARSSEASGQSRSFYFAEHNSFPQHSNSLAGAWTPNLTSLTEPSTPLLQTPWPSTIEATSSDAHSLSFDSILSSLMHEQQHEISASNFETSEENDLSSILLNSFSSINLDYDLSSSLNINLNLPVDSLGN